MTKQRQDLVSVSVLPSIVAILWTMDADVDANVSSLTDCLVNLSSLHVWRHILYMDSYVIFPGVKEI